VDWSNLKADYERLGTYKAVAAEYGVSVSTVGQHAREQGINPGYPGGSSPLEKLLQSALMKVGIGFTAGAFVGNRYFADILLNQAPIILEADGNWHKVHVERDAKRDAHLTACGFKVIRFTGAQLNRGADQCVQSVIDEHGLTPDTDPQYVIRVSMMGAENPHWTGGPQTVACTQCGSETARNNFRTAVKKPFCNSRCYGAYMSAHPEESPRKYKLNWDDVASRYKTGADPDDIMREFGIGKTTLYRHLRRMGVEFRRQPRGPYSGKYSDESRANFQRGHEKRRRNGLAPLQGQGGRFVRKAS
jgi:very-short-patch-repair endonuclease